MPIKTESTPVLRQNLANPKNVIQVTSEVHDAIRMAQSDNPIGLTTDAMVSRYARYIVKSEDAVTGGSVSEISGGYGFNKDHATEAAINGGLQERLNYEVFNYFLSWHGILGEDGENYVYTREHDIASTIPGLRAESGADLAGERWDMLSKACGSSVLYLSVDHENNLVESAVPLTVFFCAFGSHLIGTKGEMYPVNRDNIDDASVVAMQLEGADQAGGKSLFAAWMGPSKAYPLGRHVRYSAATWDEIPDPGDPEAIEYTTTGEMVKGAHVDSLANPLSLYASKNPGEYAPVYPFTVCRSNAQTGGLFPVSTVLYEDLLEFTILLSCEIGMLGKSIRGAQVLRPTDGQASTTLPPNLDEGAVVLGRGWELSYGGKSAYEVKAGGDGISDMLALRANYHHIPPMFVVPNKEGQIPSGVALMVALEDARRYRGKRVDANRNAVARRYRIERALVNSTMGTIAIPADILETWDPGEHKYPRDRGELAEDWKAQIDLGAADTADAIQDMWGLDTREQAFNWIEERAKEKADNPELAALLAPKPAQNVQGLSALQRRNQQAAQ